MIFTLIRYKRCKNVVVVRIGFDCTSLILMHGSETSSLNPQYPPGCRQCVFGLHKDTRD